MGSIGAPQPAFNVHINQRLFENRYRDADKEHIGFFDSAGNLVFEASGNYDKVDIEASGEFNHNVEQRIWAGEDINYTHNHLYKAIFSPEDIQSFEGLEAHSMTATAPDGTAYRIIRMQGITNNVWSYDSKTGQMENIGFVPKKIAPAYDKEYSSKYIPKYQAIRQQYFSGKITYAQYQEQDAKLVQNVTRHMVSWLRSNASKYGYRFIVD